MGFESYIPAINAGVQASSSMANQFIVGVQTRQNMRKQNEWNRQMADLEWQRNLEMWNKNNAYNSPQAQMERLKAAGLNPNLVYGNGATGNYSGSIPKYQAPQMDASSIQPYLKAPVMDVLGAYQDFQLKQAQIDNVRQATRSNEIRALLNSTNQEFLANTMLDRIQQQRTKAKQGIFDYSLKAASNEPWLTVDMNTGDWKSTEEWRQSVRAKLFMKSLELQKYNADIALKNAELELKQKNLQYMNWGSPAWQAIINALGLFTGWRR